MLPWLALAGVWFGTLTAPVFALCAAALVAGSCALWCRRPVVLPAIGIFVLGLGIGGLGADRLNHRGPLAALAKPVPRCVVDARVSEQAGGLGTLLSVHEARCGPYEPLRDAGRVVVDGTVADPGTVVRAAGFLLPLGDDEFERARWRAGADAELDVATVSTLSRPTGLLGLAASVRSGLRRGTSMMAPDRAGIVRGVAIGDTTRLHPATVEAFRSAGLSHLLAVSGSNVAMVLAAVGVCIRRMRHVTKIGLSAAALSFFVLVVGPDPSVLRAAGMAAIGLFAIATGRRAEAVSTLAICLCSLLVLRPSLATSVGLHLSAAATAGIILWSRPIASVARRLPNVLRVVLATTLAAQLAVAPVSIATFGAISVAGPIANLVAAPAVPPATLLGLLSGVMGTLIPEAASWTAALAEPFAAWLLHAATFFGRPEWASISVAPAWAWPTGLAALGAMGAAFARIGSPRWRSSGRFSMPTEQR